MGTTLPKPTPEQINTLLDLVHALADTIRDLGQVPSGHLYAAIVDSYDFNAYGVAINILTRSGLVKQLSNHMLVWTGPKV